MALRRNIPRSVDEEQQDDDDYDNSVSSVYSREIRRREATDNGRFLQENLINED